MKSLWTPAIIILAVASLAIAAPVGICLHAYSTEAPADKIECFEFTSSERAGSDYRFFIDANKPAVVTDYRFRGTIPYKTGLAPGNPEFDKLLKLYEETSRAAPSTRRYLNPKILTMRDQLNAAASRKEELAKLPNITLLDGTVLEGCKVSRIDGQSVSLLHADGIKKVKIAELSNESKTILNLATQPKDPITLSHTNASDVARNGDGGGTQHDGRFKSYGDKCKTKAGDDLGHKIAAIGNGIQNNDSESETKTVAAEKNGSDEVVASGVGKDEKSALKDAFRNAVEQVVGMVVDSTVQAENDEIIRDQILTASDGFIKEYKTISSEVQDGLTRVRIKAVVERKSLVQKLEAKQVIVKKVDMDNLFAKVASDAQAVHGATQILSERLTEFHKVWTAKAGEPNYDRNSGVMSIPLTIAADPSAYAASATRLAEVLNKISIRKSRKLLTSIESRDDNGKPTPARNLVYFASNPEEISHIPFFQEIVANPNNDRIKKWNGYKVTEWLKAEEFDQLPKSAFWIWLCVSERNNTTEWAGYAIDADINKIGPLLFPKWSISMILRDENGSAISSYELSNLTFDSNFHTNRQDPFDGSKWRSQMGIHPHLIDMGNHKNNKYGMGERHYIQEKKTSFDKPSIITDNVFRFQSLIAPNFMSFGEDFKPNMAGFGTGNFAYWKQEVVEATFKISPDDIKDIKKTEISISAQPRTSKTK